VSIVASFYDGSIKVVYDGTSLEITELVFDNQLSSDLSFNITDSVTHASWSFVVVAGQSGSEAIPSGFFMSVDADEHMSTNNLVMEVTE